MDRSSSPILLRSLAAACLALVACKAKNTDVTEPPVSTVEPAPVQAPVEAAEVDVDPEVASLCDLPTARFRFNSSKLDAQAQDALDSLAACFISGPAVDRDVRLVGHADPRGDEEYNFGLGQRRAGSVGQYLQRKGLAETRIETSSRGELDARGEDESGWAEDRRVSVYFGD